MLFTISTRISGVDKERMGGFFVHIFQRFSTLETLSPRSGFNQHNTEKTLQNKEWHHISFVTFVQRNLFLWLFKSSCKQREHLLRMSPLTFVTKCIRFNKKHICLGVRCHRLRCRSSCCGTFLITVVSFVCNYCLCLDKFPKLQDGKQKESERCIKQGW